MKATGFREDKTNGGNTMKNQELEQLKEWEYKIPERNMEKVLARLKDSFDKIDWYSFSAEAKSSAEVLEDELKANYGEDCLKGEQCTPETQYKIDCEKAKQPVTQIEIPRQKVTAIVAETGEGKTALAYLLCESWKDGTPVFVYNHPDEAELKKIGYGVLHSLDEAEYLSDCILYIDEPQLYFNISGSRGIDQLIKFLSLCRQKDISIIFSTSESRFFSKRIEAYITLWCIKDLDYKLVKNGGIIKDIIEQHCTFSPNNFRMAKDSVLTYCRKLDMLRVFTYAPPAWFNDRLSRPYHHHSKGTPLLIKKLPGNFAANLVNEGKVEFGSV